MSQSQGRTNLYMRQVTLFELYQDWQGSLLTELPQGIDGSLI